MKLGYSLLLGEHIEAEWIEYTDCKVFQIVCPNCKEPIFKVFRQVPPPGCLLSLPLRKGQRL